MRPLYAIAAFAGVRWGEIGRLRWEDVKEKEIVVRAVAAKTRSRRIVEISENLQAFLRPPYKPPRSLERRRRRSEREAGLTPWRNNCLRHSFISYLFAISHDENKTAAMAGNSPAMVHRYYRALVSKEEAERYWRIMPIAL